MVPPSPSASPRFPLAVAAAQLPVRPVDHDASLARAREAIAGAADRGAALVVLPEACVPGYQWGPGDPDLVQRATAVLADAARKHGLHVAMGLIDERGSILRLAAPDGRLWSYRKRYPAVGEATTWSAGSGPVIADTELGRLGLVICADILQPAVWRSLVGRVDLVAVASAWPDYRGRLERAPQPFRPVVGPITTGMGPYRRRLLPDLARTLGVPLVFANATGPWEHGEGFAGESTIYDGDGAQLAGADGQEVVVASVNRGRTSPLPRQPAGWWLFNVSTASVARVRERTATVRRRLRGVRR